MTRDELIAVLHGRVIAAHDGDDAQVTAFDALREAAELLGHSFGAYEASGVLDEAAVMAVSTLFLARAVAAPDRERADAEIIMLGSFLAPVSDALGPEFFQALGLPVPDRSIEDRYADGVRLLQLATAGDPAAADGAVTALTEVAAELPTDSEHLPMVLSNLGGAHRVRHDFTGDLTDLRRAVEIGRSAVTEPRFSAHPGHAIHQSSYGASAWQLHRLTGDLDALDASAAAFRVARDRLAPGDPEFGELSHLLFDVLCARFVARGEPADFTEAATIGPDTLGDPAADAYPRRLNNLALLYQNAYVRLRDPDQLHRALVWEREALAISTDERFRAAVLTNVCLNLRLRYELTGDPATLEEAIEAGRQSVAGGLDSHPEPHMYLNGLEALAIALRVRHELTGDLASLDEAIAIGREAVSLAAPGANRSGYLTSLGSALKLRHARVAEELGSDGATSPYLDAAVDAARAAVEDGPPGHQVRPMLLANLAGVLRMRGRPEDQEDADRALRAALKLLPDDHPDHVLCVANLVGSLRERFQTSGDPGLLTEAVTIGRREVARLTLTGKHDSAMLSNLGVVLELAGDPDAREVFRRGAGLGLATPSARLLCARAWARLAAQDEDWTEAAEAYQVAVELFTRLAARHLDRGDARHQLGAEPGLLWDAVGCAVRAGRPELAVALAEQGRGVLLGHALDLRGDLSDLRARAPALAARFDVLSLALDEETGPGADHSSAAGAGRVSEGDRRAALARDWEGLLAEIRGIDGFADFLVAPDLDDLKAAAAGGAIVIVNVSRYGGDAVVVRSTGVTAVPLPGLDLEDLYRRVPTFIVAAATMSGVPGDRAAAVVTSTMAWVWDVVVAPVLAALDINGPPSGEEWPRVWWSPTGLLTLLPLHMAGRHDAAGRRCRGGRRRRDLPPGGPRGGPRWPRRAVRDRPRRHPGDPAGRPPACRRLGSVPAHRPLGPRAT